MWVFNIISNFVFLLVLHFLNTYSYLNFVTLAVVKELQNLGIVSTNETPSSAGIEVWMLTNDDCDFWIFGVWIFDHFDEWWWFALVWDFSFVDFVGFLVFTLVLDFVGFLVFNDGMESLFLSFWLLTYFLFSYLHIYVWCFLVHIDVVVCDIVVLNLWSLIVEYCRFQY